MDVQTYMNYDALGLAELVEKKEVSPKELIEVAFERLEAVNPELQAVIRTRKEQAVQEIGKEHGPFSGVPILLKDISQAIEGEKLTAGAKLLKNHVAKHDSNFVSRIRTAGFSIIGQTNTPEFGLKNITDPQLYGPTKNPWNTEHYAGGSSGGATSAVASGIVPLAGASDGGGSIRIPASFTGLFGLKPTRGRTPVGPGVGRQWQGASIDFAVSRTVRDSAALLDWMQTIQPEAAFQTPLFEGSYLEETMKQSKRKYRVAFSMKSPVDTPVSFEAQRAVQKVVSWLEKEGHYVEEKDNGVDGVRLMHNYYLMNNGEIASMLESMEKGLGRDVTLDDVELITWALYQSGKYVTASEFTQSLTEWDNASAKMADLHKEYDFYITPTNADVAPRLGELEVSEEIKERLIHIARKTKKEQQRLVYDMFLPSLTFTPFTQLANLTGQPAMTVPVHLTEGGLPIGVQFMAPKGKENWLFAVAAELERSPIWVGMNGNPMM
ncbi:amidase [Radiobacillus kanasensis]|uniref:amidase n=1 Tax=Radiobacillus kanasensis TaxID=2844358 RepID=UPI001E36318A|nr:amidase [Radiobacillus kanasensis]UFT98653.1 amidase [Radiobacillus kanasensis]